MTKLTHLRSRLAHLRLRRQMVRWGIALAAMLLTVLVVLAAVFAVDWFFDMSRLQRVLCLLLGVACLYGAFRRFALPWLQIHETDVDVALLVERQQKIEGDLVAALQFEGADAQKWGSSQLRGAVIDYVADFSKGLNVLEGFSIRDLVRRGAVLAVAVAAVALFTTFHSNYVSAFLDRLLLGSARYPTRTVLAQVAVNGTPVDLSQKRIVVRSPYGMLVNLSVKASGETPDEGKVVVLPRDGRNPSTLKLTRDGEEPKYAAQLPELVDTLDFEVFLGDARTDSIRIEVLPLPVVETAAVVTVPDYARYAAPAPGPQNSRQLTVVEGSRVDLTVNCTNKRLKKATVTIEGVAYPLKPTDARDAHSWTLAQTESPLFAVAQPLRYEVQVTDEDGLELPQPFQGSVRIKPDQKPGIAGGALARFVLPTAKPAIHYRATDDYGVAKLLAHLDVMRKDGPAEPRSTVSMRSLPKPLLRDDLPCKGAFPLDLASLKLNKGDRLTVTLEAVDYRGPTPGQSTLSDPIIFEITDEAGILEDIAKPDYQSAEELDAIIRQQLNIGGAK